MPYEWLPPEGDCKRLHLWPYRSLPRRGMVAFLAGFITLISLPLAAVLGSKVLWGLLPFLLAAIWGLWFALNRSFADGEILEDLTLSETEITLTHHHRGKTKTWKANPHWVRPTLHPKSGPVPNYLTLQGGPREVELGAFLTSEERQRLHAELTLALRPHR
ncbi:MAG: DUF2244 domain-containing protein [Cypionkella sp.]|jgi:uncharacterized membrane protein